MILELIKLRDAGWDSIEIAAEALSHPSTVRRYIRLYDLYGAKFFVSHGNMRFAKQQFVNFKKTK